LFSFGHDVDQEFKDIVLSYPIEILKLHGIAKTDPFQLADEYYKVSSVVDMSIDPNANVGGKSPVNFQTEIFKPIMKLRSYYLIWKRLKEQHGGKVAKRILEACLNGSLYPNDLVKWEIPYCFAVDSSFWATQGRPYGFLPGGIPNKLQSFIGQTVEVIMDLSQEMAGAVGIANVLVNAAYYSQQDRKQLIKAVDYMKKLNLLDEDITEILLRMFSHSENDYAKKRKQLLSMSFDKSAYSAVHYLYDLFIRDIFQQLVHVTNNSFRLGGDSPFSNVSLFCRETLIKTFADAKYPDWTSPVDNLEEIIHLQKIFADFIAKGSPITGKNYKFPIVTVNIAVNSEGKIVDNEFFEYIARLNAKRGNFNFHIGERIATCCRLTQSLKDLRKSIRSDTYGNGGVSIGSHRVININLHGIACAAVHQNLDFNALLLQYMDYAEKLLIAHKEHLKDVIKTGVLKFFRIGWQDINMFFSTFGFVGLWDAYNVLSSAKIFAGKYEEFASSTIKLMEKYAQEASIRNEDYAFNVEETPAENASPKLAAIDNYWYKDCSWYTPLKLLSNQMIPVYEEYDAFDRLEIMGKLMNDVSGGAMCHFNIDGSMTEESSVKLTRMMIEKFKIPHFAIEIGTSTCKKEHTSIGVHQICPECGAEIDTWTRRIVGYNSDTKDWIAVRRDWENLRRKIYKINKESLQ